MRAGGGAAGGEAEGGDEEVDLLGHDRAEPGQFSPFPVMTVSLRGLCYRRSTAHTRLGFDVSRGKMRLSSGNHLNTNQPKCSLAVVERGSAYDLVVSTVVGSRAGIRR